MEREEFADFYAESFQRLVGQLYAMIGDRCEAQDADLAHDGIAAKVTVGSFCSSDPAPARCLSGRVGPEGSARSGRDRDDQSQGNSSGNGTELR